MKDQRNKGPESWDFGWAIFAGSWIEHISDRKNGPVSGGTKLLGNTDIRITRPVNLLESTVNSAGKYGCLVSFRSQ